MIGVAIFNATYFPTQQSRLINEKFRAQLEKNIEMLSLGTSISFMSHYLDGAAVTVERIEKDEDLAFILVLDEENIEILRHGTFTEPQLDNKTLIGLREGELTEIANYLILKDKIMFEEETLGTAITGLDTTKRDDEIKWTVTISLVLNISNPERYTPK